MKGKVLFWYGATTKKLDKEELFKYLVKKGENKKYYSVYGKKGRPMGSRYPLNFYNSELKEFFEDAYDVILKYLNETECIQIYQDGSIRLHLKCGYYEKKKSIFLEDCIIKKSIFGEVEGIKDLTLELLEDLITFSENN